MALNKQEVIDNAIGAHTEDPHLLRLLFSLVFDMARTDGHIAATKQAIKNTEAAIRLIQEDK